MLKKLLRLAKSFIPRPLPIGMAQFNAWADEVLVLTGIALTEKNRGICAQLIIQLPATFGFVSTRKAAAILIKAASNQVAAAVIKEAQENAKQQGVPSSTEEVGPKAS